MTATRTPHAAPMTGMQLLDMYFLDMRSHLLECAAALDRVTAGPDRDAVRADDRYRRLLAGLEILRSETPDRARRFLELFSD